MILNGKKDRIKQASRFLKAVSNEHRLMVLVHLSVGEKSVSELEELVGLSQSALSQHLARLRKERLVRTRRKAQMIFYSLNSQDVTTLLEAVNFIFSKADGPRLVKSDVNSASA